MFESVVEIYHQQYDFFAQIGFIFIAIFIVRFIATVLRYFYIHIYGRLFLNQRLQKFGKWAIITGATRGCGLEFSRQLAKLGMNLVLVARNEKLLRELANDLESKYNIKTAMAVCDFGDTSKKNFEPVHNALEGKDIGILLNNAGLMYDYPEYFHNISEELLVNMISVNVTWSQMLAHYVIKQFMLPKKNGLIVFMSSTVDERQTPLLTAYGACKAYVTYLVKCLSTEYSKSGIKFQVLAPSYIATDMTKYHEILNTPSLMSPSGESYVRNALATFGMSLHTSGYFPHDFQREIFDLVPQSIYRKFALKWQEHVNKTKRA